MKGLAVPKNASHNLKLLRSRICMMAYLSCAPNGCIGSAAYTGAGHSTQPHCMPEEDKHSATF